MFGEAEAFQQFWQRVAQGTALWNYFVFGILAKEEMSFRYFFLFLDLVVILFSGAEPSQQLWQRVTKKHFRVIILNSDHLLRRICHLKVLCVFLALQAILHFVQLSGTISVISVESNLRNISLNFFLLKRIYSLKVFPIFGSGGHFCSMEWNHFSPFW